MIAILQARMSSTRLPGKVLAPILGRPMLSLQIERIGRARACKNLIVATSDQAEDQPIADLCAEIGVAVYRGSLNDVLDRFYRAALPHRPDRVIRLTADCPLADWTVIDRVCDAAEAGGYDYCSNTVDPTWPDGLDVEVVSFEALETAWREAESPSEREHVLPFIHRRPDRFGIGSVRNDRDLSHLRWTVDEPADLDLVRCVYEALYPADPAFTTDDILDFLDAHPELVRLNAHIERNEGLKRSDGAGNAA